LGELKALSGRTAFRAVYRRGKRIRGKLLSVVYVVNTLGQTRLGFSVSGKLGGSVRRNLFKRRVRSFLRDRVDAMGIDIIIGPLIPLKDIEWKSLKSDLLMVMELLEEAGLARGS
jgi:ribonuclease P protein component